MNHDMSNQSPRLFQATTFIISHFGSPQSLYLNSNTPIVVVHHFMFSTLIRLFSQMLKPPPIELCPPKNPLPLAHVSMPRPYFIGHAHVATCNLNDRTEPQMKLAPMMLIILQATDFLKTLGTFPIPISSIPHRIC